MPTLLKSQHSPRRWTRGSGGRRRRQARDLDPGLGRAEQVVVLFFVRREVGGRGGGRRHGSRLGRPGRPRRPPRLGDRLDVDLVLRRRGQAREE